MSGLVLTVHVHRAKAIGSGDSDLRCNPYCIVRAGELKPWRSKTVRRTNSPEWHALVTFDGCQPEHLPYLQIECWDEDGSSSDDPLGLVLLPTLSFLTELGGREVTVPCGRGLGKCNGQGAVVVSVDVVEQFPPVPLSPLLTTAAATFRELVARIDATADGTRSSLGSKVWAAGGAVLALDETLEAVCRGVLLGATKASAVPAVLYISSCRLLLMPEEVSGVSGAATAAAPAAVAPASSLSSPTVAPDAPAAPLLCMPLHHLLRVEASHQTDASVGSSFLASRGGAALSRGGELHLQSLVREHVIRFHASAHGAGRSSACALVHARLSFHLSNRERHCAPLVPCPLVPCGQAMPNGRSNHGQIAEVKAELARQGRKKERSKSGQRGKSSNCKGSLTGVTRGACEVEVSSFAREATPASVMGTWPVASPLAPSVHCSVKAVQPVRLTDPHRDQLTGAGTDLEEASTASARGEGGAMEDSQAEEHLGSSVDAAAEAAPAPGTVARAMAASGVVAAATFRDAPVTLASAPATGILPLCNARTTAAPHPVRAAASASPPAGLSPAPGHGDDQIPHPLSGGTSSPDSACGRRGLGGSSGVDGHVGGSGRRRVGWDAFVPEVEWGRLCAERWGGWRRCSANAAHALCASYPRELIVPASITDGALGCSARFRSKGRVPALTWINPCTGAALCRSSQPLVRSAPERARPPHLTRGFTSCLPPTSSPQMLTARPLGLFGLVAGRSWLGGAALSGGRGAALGDRRGQSGWWPAACHRLPLAHSGDWQLASRQGDGAPVSLHVLRGTPPGHGQYSPCAHLLPQAARASSPQVQAAPCRHWLLRYRSVASAALRSK